MSGIPERAAKHARAFLATMLRDRNTIGLARELVSPSVFAFQGPRQRIFETILTADLRGDPIDFNALAEELRGRGDHEALAELDGLSGVPESTTTAAKLRGHGSAILRAQKPEAQQDPQAKRVKITHMSDVQPERVRWLWPGRIPLGCLTIFDGDPGLGKSTIAIDLAARLSRGDRMPDGSPGPSSSGTVMLSAEDDEARVIRPRLDAAGADVGRVVTVKLIERDGTRDLAICREDLSALESELDAIGAALVIIDPLVAFLPREVNANRDQDVRRALGDLRAFAERTGVAVLAIRHLNKTESANALYRGGGSIGIIGAARTGLLLATDPDDPTGERRVLAVTKSNLAPKQPALILQLVAEAVATRVQWEGESAHTPATLLAAPEEPEKLEDKEERRGQLEDAKEFLLEELADGAEPAPKVITEARANGISETTLKRARQALKKQGLLRVHKVSSPKAGWEWSLAGNPDGGHRMDGSATTTTLGLLDPLGITDSAKPRSEAATNQEGQDGQASENIVASDPALTPTAPGSEEEPGAQRTGGATPTGLGDPTTSGIQDRGACQVERALDASPVRGAEECIGDSGPPNNGGEPFLNAETGGMA